MTATTLLRHLAVIDMSEPTTDPYAEMLLLAHLRRMVIGEFLNAIPRHQAAQAVSAAIQRLSEYRDDGPVPTIANLVGQDGFEAAIDRVIEELQELPAREG